MNRLAEIPSAAISPDGARIAYVVERPDLAKNGYDDELWIYTVADGSRRRVPGSRSSYASLAWSPDGARLAFLSGDPAGGDRVYVVDPQSGVEKAAGLPSSADVLDFAWRPDGSAIAFVRRDVPPVASGAAHFEDAFEVTDNAYLSTEAAQPAHLWLADLAGGERRLTQGPWSVEDTAISWSPDGSKLLYLRARDGVLASQSRGLVFALDVASGDSRQLTPHGGFQDQALYSPDGASVLYLYQRGGDPMNLEDAMTIASDGTGDRDVTQPLDRFVDAAAWLPDGSLLIKTYDGTAGPLFVQPLDGPARRLPLGPVVDAVIAPQGSVARNGAIAFAGTETGRPDELYYLGPGASGPQRITDVNAEVAALQLGRVTEVRWTGPNGFAEDGVLTYPPGYVPGKKYPLVLRIHGGPTESSEAKFEPFYQLAASHGYLVFAPNYRGSNNLGNAYVRAIYNGRARGREVGHRGRIAARGFRVVVRRPDDVVDDRALSNLARGGDRCGRQRPGRGLRDRRRHRRRSRLHVAPAVLGRHARVQDAVADHILQVHPHAVASPGQRLRRARANRRVVRDVPRAARQPRPGRVLRLSHRRPSAERPGAFGRRVPALARLVRPLLEMTVEESRDG